LRTRHDIDCPTANFAFANSTQLVPDVAAKLITSDAMTKHRDMKRDKHVQSNADRERLMLFLLLVRLLPAAHAAAWLFP
jgi:hypothetical protein